MQITSYLFPFVQPNPKWDRFVDVPTLAVDCSLLAEIDDDMNAIIENGPKLCKKEYDEYRKIDEAKMMHQMNFAYDIAEFIKDIRRSSTCSNGACYICKTDLPYAWPSTISAKHLLAGTCSKNCFKEYKKSAVWKRMREHNNDEYKCTCCTAVIHPEDIDDVNDEAIYCSYKCRELNEYKQSDEYHGELYEIYKEQARQH